MVKQAESKSVVAKQPRKRIGEEYWKQAEGLKEGDTLTYRTKKEANAMRRKIYVLGNTAQLKIENGVFIVKKGRARVRRSS